MGFELFDKVSKVYSSKISIRSTGKFGFSQGFVNKYKLSEFKYVKMYFDREREVIGFELVNEEKPNVTAEIKRRGVDTFVSGKSFLEYYNIEHSTTKVYLADDDNENGMITIDLKNPSYESTRGSSKIKK